MKKLDLHKTFRELGVIRAFGYSLTSSGEKGFICNLQFADGSIVSVLTLASGEVKVVD